LAANEEQDFESLFDGLTLKGWELLGKRDDHDTVNFNLFSGEQEKTSQTQIGFEIHTERGFAMVSFPVSSVDATTWHELIGRYNGLVLEIVCDSKVMASKTWEGGKLSASQEPLLIGAERHGDKVVRHFHGELEEAGIWNKWISLQSGNR